MGIPVKSGKAPGAPMPVGMNQAVVASVEDRGEQPDTFNPGKMRHTVLVVFKNAAGQEAARFYTPSVHEKANLGKDVRAVNNGDVPKEFKDLEAAWPVGLLGMQCQLLIQHKKNLKGYTNAAITAVLPPAAGQNVVPAATPAPAAPQQQAAPPAPAQPAAPAAPVAGAPTTSDVGF